MKQFLLFFCSIIITSIAAAQFTDTVQLNAFIRDTIKDRRPDKVTAAQIQKGLLGLSAVLSSNNYFNANLSNNTGQELYHNARGQEIITDSIPRMEWILADASTTPPGDLIIADGGLNYTTSGGQSYYLGPELDVSNISDVFVQLSDETTTLSLSEGNLNLSNISYVNINDAIQDLAFGSNFGFNYGNTNTNSFFNTSTGTVDMQTPQGALVMNGDSAALSHNNTALYIDDNTIAFRNDSLTNGAAQYNYLTTDANGRLLLKKDGYRLGPGLTLTDGDSLYFGGETYNNVGFTVNTIDPDYGYDIATSYLTMDTTAFQWGYQGKYARFDNNGIYMNGGANQQIITAGTLRLGTNGVELGHTDNYYNTRSDMTVDVNGNVSFANNDLLSGDANNTYLTTDGSGKLFLKTVPTYTLPDTLTVNSALQVNGPGYFQDTLQLNTIPDGNINDSLLTISAGHVTHTLFPNVLSINQFAITNNQATPADITGFTINPSLNKAFVADYAIVRKYASGAAPGNLDVPFTNMFINVNLGSITGDNLLHPFAQQSSGKYILITFSATFNGTSTNRILRLNTDYTLDTLFLNNIGAGFPPTSTTGPRYVCTQPDDKILCGGDFTLFNGNTRNGLIRLNADGTEDTAFATNLGTGFNGVLYCITVLSSGQIVVSGAFTAFNGNTRKGLIRLNADGTEDTAFATNIGTGVSGGFYTMCEQPADHKILAAGDFFRFNGNTRYNLTRLNSDGTEDTAFVNKLGVGFDLSTMSLAVQPADNKILVGGDFRDFNNQPRGKLVRLNADGTEDTAFTTNIGIGGDTDNGVILANCLRLDSAGHIYVAGAFPDWNRNGKGGLVRLNADGTEDLSFSAGLGTGFTGTGDVMGIYLLPNEAKLLTFENNMTFNGDSRTSQWAKIFTDADSADLMTQGKLIGRYIGAPYNQWNLINTNASFTDNTGVKFSITNTGQLQYTSTNMPGTKTVDYIKYLVRPL